MMFLDFASGECSNLWDTGDAFQLARFMTLSADGKS